METEKNTPSRRKIVIGRTREEELEDVARKAADRVLNQDDFEEEEEDFATEEEFQETINKDVKAITEENPFIIAERLVEEGIDFEYKIKKGGKFLTTIDDPEFNETALQLYGEGTYTVALWKLTPRRVFVKQMTFRVANAPSNTNVERKTNESQLAELMVKQTNDQIKQMREEFAQKERRLEEERREEKRQREEERKEQREREQRLEDERRRNENSGKSSLVETLEVLTKIMPKPEDKSDKFMEMMMKMQENTQNIISKMDEKNERLIKESQERLEKLIEKLTANKNDGGVTERELRQEIEKARREGKEDYKEMMEMVESKAIERAEILAGKEPEEKKEESMTDTLIKSALPMLMQTMARRPAPMLQRRQAPVRKALPQPAPRPAQAQPAPQAPKRPVAPQAPRPAQTQAQAPKTAPQAPQTAKKPSMTLMTGGNTPVMDLSGLNLSKKPNPAILHTEEEKQAVGQLLMQVVGSGVMDKADPLYVSEIAYHALEAEGYLSLRVLDYYPKADLFALRDSLQLDVEDKWINTFYEDFKKKLDPNGEYVQPSHG